MACLWIGAASQTGTFCAADGPPARYPGTEIPTSDPALGKLVVVMQAARSDTLLNHIESARNLDGVLAVSLVYHQQDLQGEEMP